MKWNGLNRKVGAGLLRRPGIRQFEPALWGIGAIYLLHDVEDQIVLIRNSRSIVELLWPGALVISGIVTAMAAGGAGRWTLWYRISLGAYARFQRGEYARAAALYRLCAKVDPASSSNHFNLGVALQFAGRSREAVEAFSRCIELAPYDAEPYRARASAYESMGERDLAKADLEVEEHLSRPQ